MVMRVILKILDFIHASFPKFQHECFLIYILCHVLFTLNKKTPGFYQMMKLNLLLLREEKKKKSWECRLGPKIPCYIAYVASKYLNRLDIISSKELWNLFKSIESG